MPQNFSAARSQCNWSGAVSNVGHYAIAVSYAIVGLVFFLFSGLPVMAGCNSGSTSQTSLLSSAACQADATDLFATAVGALAAAAESGTVVGNSATAAGIKSAAFGYLAYAEHDGAVSVGAYADGAGAYSVALGGMSGGANATPTRAAGTYGIAIGGGDGASFSPSVGPDIVINLVGAQASGLLSAALGTASKASGGGSTAIGLYARSTADDSIALGEFSTSGGPKSIAGGLWSETSAANAIALGYSSKVTGDSGIALGTGAQTTGSGSVAIGANSIASAAKTVSVGAPGNRRRITNVAPGKAASDAVTLAQLQAATAANQMASATDELREEIVTMRAAIRRLESEIANLKGQSTVSVTFAPVGGR